jgi:hypothetical protein
MISEISHIFVPDWCCSISAVMKLSYQVFSCLVATVLLLLTITTADEDEVKSKKESVGTVIGIDLGTTYSW